MAESYDLVVVGAGPAGSSAAWTAAQRGVRVLLIDQRERIGIPVQCAELVTAWISHHIPLNFHTVVQPIDRMILHFPDGTTYETKNPGYMLDRSRFDQALAISAARAGAELSTETKALQVTPEGPLIQRGRKKHLIRARVIIAADGVRSTVARSINLPPLKVMKALQYEIVLFEPQTHTDIYFNPDYKGGYAWLFPKGHTANAGVGVIPSKTSRLPELLERFLNQLKASGKWSKIEIVSKTGGLIPCEPRSHIVFENILFVGDAAGHAHPITGAGILNAVLGGTMAGKIAVEALLRGDLGYLEHYEIEWNETFGKSLRYGFLKRNFLEENWNEPSTDFNALIRKTWVGFKEYYEERRKEKP